MVREDLGFLDFLGEGFADGEGSSVGGSEGESSELISITTAEHTAPRQQRRGRRSEGEGR